MDIAETINKRHSVRAFLDQPVDRSTVEAILHLATRSPSWGNTQPWEMAVVSGQTKQALVEEFCQNVQQGRPASPDFSMPEIFPDLYQHRYRAVGKEVFKILGIQRGDHPARLKHYLNNFRAFGAPCLVYLMLDQGLESVYSIFDCGSLAGHICLSALPHGLGTCLLAAISMYPDAIRMHLQLPPEKKVVLGLALGYPRPDVPLNQMRTPREPLTTNVKWVDVD